MINRNTVLKDLGLHLPEILLPKKSISPEKWSVIACDQHSSNVQYWEQVSTIRGTEPSTLDLILPELYLDDKPEERISCIQQNMHSYLQQGYLENKGKGWVYLERSTSIGQIRSGLVLAIDLNCYEFKPHNSALIRATEDTIVDRLPQRMEIRKNAPIELPHVLVLIDDHDCRVIEGLQTRRQEMEEIYNFDLMLGAGHLRGYWLNNPILIDDIAEQLQYLQQQSKNSFLYAVGDGNHSLAAAKLLWEDIIGTIESEEEYQTHPARFALVEVINIHSHGLSIEAIHRCFFNLPSVLFFDLLRSEGIELGRIPDSLRVSSTWEHNGLLFFIDNCWYLLDDIDTVNAASLIDELFEKLRSINSEIKIDFTHGWDNTLRIAESRENCMAVFLNPIQSKDLFSIIENKGVLPRKTFSLGASEDKRFYFEARKIMRN